MKNKSNGVHRARLNDHAYDQVDGVHYESTNIAYPITNNTRIKIVLALAIMTA